MMTSLTLLGPEAAPFVLSLAYHLACLDHCVMVVYVGPDHDPCPTDAAHLAGIRLGQLHTHPDDLDQALQAVSAAGFGHVLVLWGVPGPPPTHLAPTRLRVVTADLSLQELGIKLAQLIDRAWLDGAGTRALTVTDVPLIH